MQERFYSVQKARFCVRPGAQANGGVAFFEKSMARFWGFDGQYTGLEIQSIT